MAVISNPRWADDAQNSVRVSVDGVETSISRNDPSDTFRTLFDAITAGDYGSIGEYVPVEPVIFDPASMPRVELPVQVFAPVVDEPASGPIGWLDFLALFTQSEQISIANSTDELVRYFLMVAQGLGGDMHLNDPRVAQGLDVLIGAGLIDAARKARVLARQKPEE